ncbi:MAG: FAD-dependent oxidoreductase [Dongiaceae bacterium]
MSRAEAGTCRVAIVGAGISGLAAAWSLRDLDLRVLEAADLVGGRLRTETRDPYWLNLGAHVLLRGGPMATLAAEAGVGLIEPPGEFLAIALGGRVVRARSGLSALLGLPLSLPARLSLARVGWRMARARRLGQARLDRMTFAALLGPMHPEVEALMRVVANRLTGELDQLSAWVGVNGFRHLWLGSRLNIDGGSAALPAALHQALGARIETGARVGRIRQAADHVEIEYRRHGTDHRLAAETCIVAIPAPLARDLVADLPADRDGALARFRYTPFVVAGLFTGETGAMPWDDLYAVAVPGRSFCMLFNPANALRGAGPRRPGGSLVVYAVADRAAALLPLADREIERRYLDDLTAIFPQLRGIVREVVIQRWPLGTALGYPGRAADVDSLAAGWDRIAFAGDYMMPADGVDASQSGRIAAATIRARLGG